MVTFLGYLIAGAAVVILGALSFAVAVGTALAVIALFSAFPALVIWLAAGVLVQDSSAFQPTFTQVWAGVSLLHVVRSLVVRGAVSEEFVQRAANRLSPK